MKKALLIFITAATLTSPLLAQSQRHDGYWWKSLDDGRKLFFVSGFVQAMELAQANLYFVDTWGNPSKETKNALNMAQNALNYTGIYVGQFRDGVNSLYADYRNQGLEVSTALIYVRDQIKGKPQAELDRWLTEQRNYATTPPSGNEK
jgi:hypothetical protein